MISDSDMIEARDDRRHTPAEDALPLWNESWWFTLYDPVARLGVVTRIGIQPNRGAASVWFHVSLDGKTAHTGTDLRRPVPLGDIDALSVGGVTYRCLEPLRTFQLVYEGDGASMDVTWSGAHPVFAWPVPPGSTESQFPRHIEQGGRARGTVTLGGRAHAIDTVGHRDHSWGGERDWTRMERWHYVSGDFGDFSFNAVRVMVGGGEFSAGYVWDGKEIMGVTDVRTEVEADATGRRPRTATVGFLDERGRAHAIAARVMDVCEVDLGRTNCNDGYAEFRMGERTGYGIVELGTQHP